ILHKPDQSGRMIKWAIELGVHEIRYEPRTTIKGQAVADFLLECEPESYEEEDLSSILEWKLFVNGSATQAGSGIRIEIQTSDGTALRQAIHLEFPASNNEAEYEALIAGLRLAQTLQVKNLQVFSDSQLIIKQVNEEYQPKDDRMKAYKEL